MGRSLFALAALAAGAVAALAEDVVTLTTDSFAKAVKDNDKLVVEFYAPWCGHCKNLAPEWETAAGKLKDEGIILAKVDATEEKDLASKFEIKGFPTIKIFRGSEDASEYDGPRQSAGIVSHLKKQFGPAVSELKSEDDAQKAAKPTDDVSVVGVFESASSAGFRAFSDAAEALRNDASFFYATDAKLVSDASSADTILLYRDFDEPMVKFEGKLEKDDIAKFVEKNSEPKLPELDRSAKNKKAMARIFGDDKPKVLGVAKADFADLKGFKENLIAIQEATPGVHVIFVDPEANKGAMNFFGASEDKLPAILVHDGANDSKYNSGVIKLDDMKKYVEDFTAGKLEKSVKSEEPPADNTGPVKIATAKTLGDIVDSGKNVLIEFYAPWCGHCKKLEPTFKELGESYQSEEKVVIAKMDATANDVTDKRFDVQGFPTLYFVSEKGEVKKYDSGRDLDSLQAYIKKETGLAAAAAEDADTDPVDAAKDAAAAGDMKKDEL